MPTPNAGEDIQHFVSRCISARFHEGNRDKARNAAICYSIYRQWKRKKL